MTEHPDIRLAPMSAPISLYLTLEDGVMADLEVASRAAIAFAEVIREIGYIIDPSMEIRLELYLDSSGTRKESLAIRA